MVGDGPERYTIEKLCRESGLCQHIIFLGKQENVRDILGITDLFLLPSANESFGLAVLEALACGVPCVTTNAGGLPEVNIDGETGFTVGVGDIHALSEKVKIILDDKSLRQKFQKNAKKISREMYNSDKIVPQYIEYYKRILEE
jgi:glycosyltransferase involved in cell wall biosynthesis